MKLLELKKPAEISMVISAGKRAENGVYLSEIFKEYDILIGPTMPVLPFDISKNVPSGWDHKDLFCWTPFTYPFNLTKNPSSSINCNFTESNLPVGMQLVGPLYKDNICFILSLHLEKAFDLVKKWPSNSIN